MHNTYMVVQRERPSREGNEIPCRPDYVPLCNILSFWDSWSAKAKAALAYIMSLCLELSRNVRVVLTHAR